MNVRSRGLDVEAAAELRDRLGDRFSTSDSVREHHGRDESPLPAAPPDAVAYPVSTDEVSSILRICSTYRVPVIPFGAGTSLEGHVLATTGGVALDLANMDRIVDVRVDDMDATVEAGVTRKVLNERVRREGLFFPVDPGADATIGGMTATGATGTTTVRYGGMRENVLGMKVVLASGEVVDTAHRARKSAAGYDLTRLFIGSEGTLGVITDVTLRLYGTPEVMAGAVCRFPDIDRAVRCVIALLQQGIPVARVEFVDEASIHAINAHSGTSYEAAPSLFIEFHGSEVEVGEQSDQTASVVAEFGGTGFTSSVSGADRTELWRARHDHFYATVAMRPGARAITTDVCVPISALARAVVEARRDVDAMGLDATIAGHVGDGNFHVVILVDPDDPEEMGRAEAMNDRLVERAIAAGGTCTGEHGIGIRKRGFLARELPAAVGVMRSVKAALDPDDILNPGKVLLPPS